MLTPEDDRRWRITQGGRGRGIREMERPETEALPGDYRDLGTDQGRQRG